MSKRRFCDISDKILKECKEALDRVDDKSVQKLLDMILHADKIFYIGVGRVLIALQAMGKRLSHLGLKVYQVGEINEPAISKNDIIIVGSGSGESIIPVAIAKKAKDFGAKIVHIGSNNESSLKLITDLMIRIPVPTKLQIEDELYSFQPMTSLFEQALFIFSDILTIMLIEEKDIDINSLWKNHANLE